MRKSGRRACPRSFRRMLLNMPGHLTSQPSDSPLPPEYFKYRKHRWSDGDACEQRSRSVHDHAELRAFLFGESLDERFDILFGVGVRILDELGFKARRKFRKPLAQLEKLRQVLRDGCRIEIVILAEI